MIFVNYVETKICEQVCTFIKTCHPVHVVLTTRISSNEISKNSHRHVRPIVMFDYLEKNVQLKQSIYKSQYNN